jgi:hypothetical protein
MTNGELRYLEAMRSCWAIAKFVNRRSHFRRHQLAWEEALLTAVAI